MPNGDPKTPPPLPEDEGRKIDDFRRRAAPILAQHGGVNVESQLKLRVLADELGLSGEQFHAAVAASEGAGPAEAALAPEQRERLARFSKNIVRSLRKQNRDVLTAQIEERLIEAGCTRYQLPEDLARSTVRQIAAENGIRSISKAEAQQFIAELVQQRSGETAWIDQSLRQRAYAEGQQWGLSRDEVTELISRHSTAVRRRGWLERLILVMALLAVFAVGGLLAWILIPRGAEPDEQVEQPQQPLPAVAGDPSLVAPKQPAEEPPATDWWDVDLAVAMGRARKALPNFLPVLENIQSPDPQKRGQAYDDLIRRLQSGLDDEVGRRVLQEIVVGVYALEPSDQNATRLLESLLALIPTSGSDLPQEESAYLDYYWTIATAVAALKREAIPPSRSNALAIALGQVVGQAVDPTLPAKQLTEKCIASMLKRFYRSLNSLAAVEPGMAPDRHTALMVQAANRIDPETRQRLDVDFLAEVLPGPSDRWRDYVSLIRECAASPDVLNVLRMVDVYETANNPKLQEYLRSLLLPRAGIRTDSRAVSEVAQHVREALGATLTSGNMTPANRWRLLEARSRRAIQQATATADQPERLLAEGLQLAGLATLACALQQKELGYPVFDQLGPSLLKSPDADPAAPVRRPTSSPTAQPPRVSTASRNQANILVASLHNYRRLDTLRRVYLLNGLARLSGQLPDLKLDQGGTVAEYLLTPKPEKEAKQIAPLLRSIGRWQSVRLGLADKIMSTTLAKPYAVAVIAELLGRDLNLDNEENWRAALRATLMKEVLAQLPLSGAGGNSALGRAADNASDSLLEYLGTWAQLLGIAPDEYRGAASPAARMRLLVDRYAAALARRSLRPDDREYLDNLPNELTAISYVATTDLAQTVMLQRVWLRLLAIGVAQQRPDRAEQADRFLAAAMDQQHQADSLLVQFRDIQRAILETWLLSSELP